MTQLRAQDYRQLFELSSVGQAQADPLMRHFLRVNRKLCALLGYPADELLATTCRDITHPDDRDRDEQAAARLAQGQLDEYAAEKRYLRKDGSILWAALHVTLIRDDRGRPLYAAVVVEDTTERKQFEASVQQARDRLALALDAISGFIYEYDLVTGQVERSPGFATVLGYDIGEIAPTAGWWFEQIHPDDREPAMRAAAAARESNVATSSLEYRVRHKRGHYLTVWDRSVIHRDASGRAVRLLGTTVDVSALKHAEVERAQLLEREQIARQRVEAALERLRLLHRVTSALTATLTPRQVADAILTEVVATLGAQAGTVVVLVDDDLEVLHAVGYHPDIVAAYRRFSLHAVTPLGDAVRTRQLILVPSRQEAVEPYPVLASIPSSAGDGALVAIPLVVDERVIGAVGLTFVERRVFSDEDQQFMRTLAQQCAQALDRARLYTDERRAREAAQEAVRVRDAFLAIAAHELRTPLTAMIGQAQLLQRRMGRADSITDRERNTVAVIVDQTRRLDQMIGVLLDVSRIEQGQLAIKRRPVDLRAITQRAIEELRPSLERHSVTYDAPDAPLLVEGDELRLAQVVQNLLTNAIKYSPQGGPIAVAVAREGGEARLTVTDRGIGIPQHELPNLFRRFYRVENSDTRGIGGIGVGLYVVKEIVALHGGDVRADSQGDGSSFTVVLPALAGCAP